MEQQPLLGYLRTYWKVEKHLRWRRDVLLDEDRCRVCNCALMEMLAVLNSVALSLMHVHRVSLVARQLCYFAFHPEEAFFWLLEDF